MARYVRITLQSLFCWLVYIYTFIAMGVAAAVLVVVFLTSTRIYGHQSIWRRGPHSLYNSGFWLHFVIVSIAISFLTGQTLRTLRTRSVGSRDGWTNAGG